MAKKKLFFSILVLFYIGCSNQKVTDENFYKSLDKGANLKLEKVDEFTLHGSDTLEIAAPNYRFVSNHDQSRFVFFDVILNRFLITNKNGRIIQTIGRRGRGPYEFQQVYTYNYDYNNNLIAYDHTLRLMKIFDQNGILVNTLKIGHNTFTVSGKMLISKNKRIYVGIRENQYNPQDNFDLLSAWRSKYFASFTFNGDSLKLFGNYDPFLKNSKSSHDRTIFTADFVENLFYTTHANSYRIQAYDIDTGDRVAYFGYQSKNFGVLQEEIPRSLSREERFRRRLKESETELIYSTENYIIVFFINGSDEWLQTKDLSTLKYYCAIYDKENYDFLDEIKLPYRLGLVADENLYLIEDENPSNYKIGIYEFF